MPRNKSRITITLDEKLLANLGRLIDGVKIKNRSHAIEYYLSKNLRQKKIRIAVILAGGKGICLNGKTKMISKSLAEYEGCPMIDRVIKWLKSEGIEEVIVFAGKFSDTIKKHIDNHENAGLKISYESEDLGTAGSLKFLRGVVEETFIMINGDVLCEAKVDEIYGFHKKNGGYCTICMTSKKEPHFFGSIKLSGNQIVDFIEKPGPGKEESYLINAGIYLMEPEVCLIASDNKYKSLERDLFPALSKQGRIYGYYLNKKWQHLTE